MKTSNLLHRIARVENALKTGQLDSYAPAKSLTAGDGKTQHSWGPAMRR